MRKTIILIGLALALGLLTPSASAGTVAYYRFDGGNLYDSTGVAAHNGSVLSGTPSYSTSVPVSQVPATGATDTTSLVLGTGDSVSFNYAFPLNGTAGTVEFWIDPSLAGLPSTWGDLDLFWTKLGGGDYDRYNIALNTSNGFGLDYRDPSGNVHGVVGTGAGSIPNNVWTFVALVKNGDVWSIYLNGATTPTATATLSGTWYPDNTGWTINGRWECGCGTAQMAGMIDELRISDTALTPSQFLYASETSGTPEPGSLATIGSGLAALACFLRRRRSGKP